MMVSRFGAQNRSSGSDFWARVAQSSALSANRKDALFAGSDKGGEHWAVIASLIETCKLNSVEPLGYLADILTRIVNGHPNSQINDLLPWAYILPP